MQKKWMKKGMGKKGDMEIDTIIYWIIGLAILVVAVIGFMILKNKNIGAVEFIKNIFRFGGRA
jgi:hypothetical protein